MTTKALKPITDRIQVADIMRQRYRLTIEAGASVEEAIDRKTWVHVAKQLRGGDIIELLAADNAWYAEALVSSVEVIPGTGVHIPTFALLGHYDLATAKKSAAPEDGAYEVKFHGADKFVIIRTADKVKIEKGIATKEAAESRLAELLAA